MNKHLTFGLPKKSMEDLWLTPSRRFKNPRNQFLSRFQSGEELVNSVGK